MTLAIAIAGLVVSLAVAAFQAYALFFLRPDLKMIFDWAPYELGALEGWGLLWTVANVGRRKTVLRDVQFVVDADLSEHGHRFQAAVGREAVPSVLDANATTITMWMAEPLGESHFEPVRGLLGDGRITGCVATTLERRGPRQWVFDVPAYPGIPGRKDMGYGPEGCQNSDPVDRGLCASPERIARWPCVRLPRVHVAAEATDALRPDR